MFDFKLVWIILYYTSTTLAVVSDYDTTTTRKG